jgi:hypothetical protein
MPPVILIMNDFRSLAIATVAVVGASLVLAGPAVATSSRETPREAAQRIETLTAGGPYDPVVAPAFAYVGSDPSDAQGAARLR